MHIYTTEELMEARRSIASTQSKCEKSLLKLQPGKSQHTLTVRRVAAFKIALELIDQELAQMTSRLEAVKEADFAADEDANFPPKKKLPEQLV